jgi:hypothetical protein
MNLATNPVSLEAVLRAEKAVLDSQLEACWALQRACIVLAVGAHTLLLRRWLGGHRGGSEGFGRYLGSSMEGGS